jgi:glucose 1-dehydrogenase
MPPSHPSPRDPLAAFNLSGRVALVTGTRREIGRAIALALAAHGATIGVHHLGSEEETRDAASVVEEVHGRGADGTAFAADFAGSDAGTRLAAEITTAYGRVDILILNASIEIPEDFQAIGHDSFEWQISVNLRATLDLLQDLVPPMAERGWGRVLTIGSVQQVRPHPAMLVYAGTKAAQLNWVLNLARQFGGRGVTVNNLAPGAIATARNRAQLAVEGAELVRKIPVGRLGTLDDLVGAALLRCSDAGRYINGANLFVDGGRHIA